MDAIEIKDFSALTGYTNAILAIDEWLEHKPYFYVIKDQYLIDEAIRVEYHYSIILNLEELINDKKPIVYRLIYYVLLI